MSKRKKIKSQFPKELYTEIPPEKIAESNERMKEDMRMSDVKLQEDKAYFKFKMEKALVKLNKSIEGGMINEMEESWKRFIRIYKQWILIDDALAVFRLSHGPREL